MKKLSFAFLVLLSFVFTASNLFALPIITQSIHTDWEFETGLFYGFDGDGHTYDYASYINFSDNNHNLPDWATGTSIGTNPNLPNMLTYGHTLPAGLTVPPDQVLCAKLWIDAYLVRTDNNVIQIEDRTLTWDPLNNWSILGFGDNSLYNLTDIDLAGFWNNDPLNIEVTAGEWRIRIDRSILMMDYTTSPVPEPGTLLLLGMGLLGSGILVRRKK